MNSKNPEQLTGVSIIICDDVFRDQATGKTVIVGTFNNINTASLPFVYRRSLTVLFTLTNGKGEYNLRLAIEHEETGQEIFSLSGPLKIADPLDIADFDVKLDGIRFVDAGKYWVKILSDQRIVIQRPFNVTLVTPDVQGTQGQRDGNI